MRAYLKISFISIALVLISTSSFAVDVSIDKAVKPPSVLVMNGGKDGLSQGLAIFSLSLSDFRGTLNKQKTLTGVEWRTTRYPNSSQEQVKICYMLPFTAQEVLCDNIAPNSSGNTTKFNNFSFGNGSRFTIRHFLQTTQGNIVSIAPTGQDSIKIKYRY